MYVNLHCQWTGQLTIVGAISWAAADHWFVHFRSSLICAAGDRAPVSHRGPGPLVVSCGRISVPLFMMQILCRKCVCAVLSHQYSTDSADVSGIIRIDAINNLYRPSKCCFNSPYLCWVQRQHLQLPPSVRAAVLLIVPCLHSEKDFSGWFLLSFYGQNRPDEVAINTLGFQPLSFYGAVIERSL